MILFKNNRGVYVKEINNYLLKFYTKNEIIRMVNSSKGSLYSYSLDNIKQKIEYLISLGYTKNDVIKMTRIVPILYSHSKETISKKIEDLINLGYQKEEVIKMT